LRVKLNKIFNTEKKILKNSDRNNGNAETGKIIKRYKLLTFKLYNDLKLYVFGGKLFKRFN